VSAITRYGTDKRPAALPGLLTRCIFITFPPLMTKSIPAFLLLLVARLLRLCSLMRHNSRQPTMILLIPPVKLGASPRRSSPKPALTPLLESPGAGGPEAPSKHASQPEQNPDDARRQSRSPACPARAAGLVDRTPARSAPAERG